MKRIAMLLTLSALLSLLTISCELKRANPLDPVSHSITVPPKVVDLSVLGSGTGVQNKYIQLTWRRNSSLTTDGYYFYMGLAYNSAFAVVDTFSGNPASSEFITSVIPIASSGYYYIKVSGYKNYPSGKLEGPLSEWASARVY